MGYGITTIAHLAKTKKVRLTTAVLAVAAVSAAALGVSGRVQAAGPNCNVSTTAYPTVQAAVADSSCSTIKVAPGTHTEAGQIVINRNLSIVGANKNTTIIRTSTDTTGAYLDDSSAWILVNSGFTFNLSGVTLNGGGMKITNAILSHGSGTIDGNIIKNIAFEQSGPAYNGAGIALYGANMKVSNNDFSDIGREGVFTALSSTATIKDNTYTGKGTGNWLDYAFEVGHNSTASITGNTVSANTGVATVDGSTSAGILVSTYYDVTGTASGATITKNTITGNTEGIAVGASPTDASVVVAHNNDVSGNSTNGVSSTNAHVNATCNWWGAANGPSSVGSGSGDHVTANVTFSPWLKTSNLNGSCNDNGHHDNDGGHHDDQDKHHEHR